MLIDLEYGKINNWITIRKINTYEYEKVIPETYLAQVNIKVSKRDNCHVNCIIGTRLIPISSLITFVVFILKPKRDIF